MAGDWIKYRKELPRDPAVIRIGNQLNMDVYAVAGRLAEIWSWAGEQTTNGRVPGANAATIDSVVHHQGFASAMASVGWLDLEPDAVRIPKWDRHNSNCAKQRLMAARRAAKSRARHDAGVTKSAPREERRRAAPSREEEEKEKGSNQAFGSAASELPAERKQVLWTLSAYRHHGHLLFDSRAAAAIVKNPNATLKQVTWAIARFEEHCKQQKQMRSPAGYLRRLIETHEPPGAWSEEYNRRQLLRIAAADKDAMRAAGQQLTALGQPPGAFVHVPGGAVGPGGGKVAG